MAKRDLSLHQFAVRLLACICAGFILLFGLELWSDLRATGVPWSDLHATSHAGQQLASCVSRAFNNLTAMVLTFIALAVPITANMYTPKLIEIFIRDKVNIAAMVFFATMGAHAIFGQGMMYDQWSPSVIYTALWVSGIAGFAVLIPYYFYVLNFLNPVTIIGRVTDLLYREFDDIRAGTRPLPEARSRLDQEILNLGNVILRAVDRTDRDVSLDAIFALQRAVMRYVEIAEHLPPEWFDIEPTLFTGFSRDAIGFIRKDRIWVEQKCLHQLMLAYSATLSKMPDAISAISGVNRRIAIHATRHGNEKLLGLCVRYMNTYLREGVKKKDVHGIYDVYSQYSFLAKELLLDRPEMALQIARHFKYYASFARLSGMPFIYELAAYDLVGVLEEAFERKSPVRAEMLDLFLSFETEKSSARLTKAQVLLAAYFREKTLGDEETLVAAAVQRSSAEQIEGARREMMATHDQVFWEVTDRQRNLDFVDAERFPSVQKILDEAVARKRDGVAGT